MVFWKILFLFLVAWQLPIIVVRTIHKLSIKPMSFFLLAAGITGFVYLQFLMWGVNYAQAIDILPCSQET